MPKNALNQVEARIEAVKSKDSTKCYLYGDVGESWWSSGITATKVRSMLENAETQVVVFHVNTPGGDVNEGIAICNTFRNSEKESHIIIDGEACSAGSYMILGADKIIMYDNTRLMIHKPWTYAVGNSTQFRKLADDMDKYEESMITTYMSRFKGTEDELIALLEEETYLSAQEAFDLGFCDEVIEFVPEGSKGNQNALSAKEQLLNKYGGQRMSARSKPQGPPAQTSGQPENTVLNNFLNILGGK